MAKASNYNDFDGDGRKQRERKGLETPVVSGVNAAG